MHLTEPANETVRAAIEAHGGLDRWRRTAFITAQVELDGLVWATRTREHPLPRARVTVETTDQRTSLTPFGGPDRRSSHTPDVTALMLSDGRVDKARSQPRSAFATDTADTAWDELQLAYFTGFAFWNYLNLPFLLAWPGFTFEAAEPYRSPAGTWQRIGYSYPDDIVTHNRTQALYFDDDHVLQRLDYNSEIFGGQATAHIVAGYQTVAGFRFPTRRVIVPRFPDGSAPTDSVLIGMRFTDIEVADAAS